MKKNYTLTLAALLLISGSAFANPFKKPEIKKFVPNRSQTYTFKGEDLSGKIYSSLPNELTSKSHAPKKNTEPPLVIWGIKDGDEQMYSKAAAGIYPDPVIGYILPFNDKYLAAELIWGDEDDVYFRDPITYSGVGSYIKGNVEGNTITVDLPQTILWVDDDPDYPEGYGVNLGVVKYTTFTYQGEERWNYILDKSIDHITYTIGENGVITLNLPGEPYNGQDLPEYALGLVYSDDDSWTQYCEYYQEYTHFDQQPINIPEDLETEPYAAIIDDYGFPLEICIQDETVYIRGLCSTSPDICFTATIVDKDADGKTLAYVPANQLLGTYFGMYFVVTKFIKLELIKGEDPDGYEDYYEFTFAPDNYRYYIEIDNETKIIRPQSDEYYLCFNYSFDNPDTIIEGYNDFKLIPQSSYAGTPCNASDLAYDESWINPYGYVSFDFILPELSTIGTLLDSDLLYYRIFVNGKEQIFKEEEGIDLIFEPTIMYMDVPTPTSLLPYNFNNGWDIYKFDTTVFSIGLYLEGINTLGVQAVYLFEDSITESDIMTLDVETGEISSSGVESIKGSADIVSTEYFTIDGKKISNPSKGLYLKKQRLSDGTLRTVKSVIR